MPERTMPLHIPISNFPICTPTPRPAPQPSVRRAFGVGLLMLSLTACGGAASTAAEATAEAAMLAQGETLYVEHCAACHGVEGEGQPNWQRPGPNGRLPAPPHTADGHTWHHSDQQLLHIIAQGSILPNSDMPAYAELLDPQEMEASLAYIKTFWGPEELEFQQMITARESE